MSQPAEAATLCISCSRASTEKLLPIANTRKGSSALVENIDTTANSNNK